MKTEAVLIVSKSNPRLRGVKLAENHDSSCTNCHWDYRELVLKEQADKLKLALEYILAEDYEAPHDATDFALSFNKGLCLTRIKRLASKALKEVQGD